MKTDTVFKRAYNDALGFIAGLPEGEILPSENALGRRLGVSRTTARKVVLALVAHGVISQGSERKILRRPDVIEERFPESETVPMSAQVERQFMDWLLRDDPRPGTTINERELARRFGVATTGIREFLNRFQRFGLIDKRPNAGWVFRGFTTSFALELFEVREMYEVRSAIAFAALPENSPLWRDVEALRREHEELLGHVAERYREFSDLDSRFHLLINSAAPNRFIDSFYDLITLIFHYHYKWNKRDERQRNEVAIKEHLTYMDALRSRNRGIIELACRAHLTSARESFMRSTQFRGETAAGRPKAERAAKQIP
ncbi:MAG: GntR family transcriptional regulator [Devosia nanyangense]|uniref:GntR family transcriptional regulator n=1 Tax=Devosia nanyangense TaxID=1228055 RepID=A0A933L334_9HYPH|nr:GntR family transcriptional regulator [Devosia nanyangense]